MILQTGQSLRIDGPPTEASRIAKNRAALDRARLPSTVSNSSPKSSAWWALHLKWRARPSEFQITPTPPPRCSLGELSISPQRGYARSGSALRAGAERSSRSSQSAAECLILIRLDRGHSLPLCLSWLARCAMFTSAECQAHADEKLAQAAHGGQHRKRLITAAEAWLFLAGQIRQSEAALALANGEVVTTKHRSKKRR
jgi:hypothetical protein